MRNTLAILLVSVASISARAGGDDDARFEVAGYFYTPSHNIFCNYYDAGGEPGTAYHDQNSEVHCARLKPTPLVVILTGKGVLSINKNPRGDAMETTVAEMTDVLAYAASQKNGAHICLSTQMGVKCTAHGKGFILSKSGVKEVP